MGIPVIAQITRQGGANFPIAAAEDIKGAFCVVADVTARDAIPTNILRTGAVVRIGSSSTYYEWNGSAWISFTGFGGGGSAIDWKQSVRAATAAALPANTRTSNVLTANANGALPAQDAVTLIVGDRLLVKNEATGANNGIYTVTAVGSGGAPWSLTRATDCDTSVEVTTGLTTIVEEGTVAAGKPYILTTANPITVNTTALAFAQLSSAAADGTTITASGGTFSVATGGVGATQLAANAVTTTKILDGNVTAAKLSALSITDIAPVACATTTNVALTGTPAGLDTGVTLTTGVSRILVAFQTAPAENGIYVYNSGGAWTRATDADATAEFRKGVWFVVDQGATYGSCLATCIVAPTTLGTDAVQYGLTQSAGVSAAQLQQWFGDGSDGPATITGSLTLQRDMYYSTLVIGAGAAIQTNGYRIFCSISCDISAAPTGAIKANGNPGSAGSGAAGGSGGVGYNPGSISGSNSGAAGGASNNGAGTGGAIGIPGNNGGGAGTGATGGTGSGGAGGAGATVAATLPNPRRRWESQFIDQNGNGIVLTRGGSTGGSGGGGGGNGAAAGGGGGGSGSSGGVGYLSCRLLITGTNVNTAIFQAVGGSGGAGAAASNSNTGGGGGGSGSGGGWWFIAFLQRVGSTIANAIKIDGGAGGAGGNGNGTGNGANGGPGGNPGRATVVNMGAGTSADSFAGPAGGAGGAASGTTGGIAGTAGAYLVNL
jgi:hypothetical protein